MHKRDDVKLSIEKQMKKAIFSNSGRDANIKENKSFQVHFCNYTRNSEFHDRFGSNLRLNYNHIIDTPRSYMDVFPKEKLVYLSPNATIPMTDYDPNKVYIIGSIIDYDWKKFEMATLKQAKLDGIACECLPIDQNIKYYYFKFFDLIPSLRVKFYFLFEKIV